MNKNVFNLLCIACKYRKKYSKSNPEIGLAPTDKEVISWVIDEAKLTYEFTDKQWAELTNYLSWVE